MRRSAGGSSSRRAPPLTLIAIGREGWAIAERPIDFADPLTVRSVADELRATVRSDRGWIPRIVVRDAAGRDVTRDYDVD